MALASGADLKATQDMLGHANTVLTADTYTSVLPEVRNPRHPQAGRQSPRAHAQWRASARSRLGPLGRSNERSIDAPLNLGGESVGRGAPAHKRSATYKKPGGSRLGVSPQLVVLACVRRCKGIARR